MGHEMMKNKSNPPRSHDNHTKTISALLSTHCTGMSTQNPNNSSDGDAGNIGCLNTWVRDFVTRTHSQRDTANLHILEAKSLTHMLHIPAHCHCRFSCTSDPRSSPSDPTPCAQTSHTQFTRVHRQSLHHNYQRPNAGGKVRENHQYKTNPRNVPCRKSTRQRSCAFPTQTIPPPAFRPPTSQQ